MATELRGTAITAALAAVSLAMLLAPAVLVAQNQVPNATFDVNVAGWSLAFGPATVDWSPIDADNLPNSGSLRMRDSSACGARCLSVAGLETCLSVTDLDEYTDEWKIYVPFVGTEVGVGVQIDFHSTPDCGGAFAGVSKCYGIYEGCFSAMPQGSWQTIRINDFDGVPPPGTAGVHLFLTLAKEETSLPVTAHFDNIYFSQANQRSYVALGDSFASGEGTFSYDPESGACHRSPSAYPETADLQDGVGLTRRFYACSGATTRNVLPESLGGEPQNGDPSGATQLDRAPIGNARLVTVGIGGNDARFKEALTRMFGFPDAFARPYGQITYGEWLDQHIRTTVRANFAEVLTVTMDAAPSDAVVLVIGYPQIFPTGPFQLCDDLHQPAPPCPPVFCSFSPAEQDMARTLTATLNQVLADVADEQGALFVPVEDYFEDHEVCGSDPITGAWINPLTGGPESFHPKSLGHWYGYKPAIEAFIASMGGLDAMAQETQSRRSAATVRVIEQAGPSFGDLALDPVGGPTCDGSDVIAAGQDVHLSGEGFQSLTSVDLRFFAHGSMTSLGTLVADGSGAIDGLVTVPLAAAGAPMALIEAQGLDSQGFVRVLEATIQVGDPIGQDSDADGVPDVCDVCPTTSDPMQLDGDGDGRGDACDVCPGDPENDIDQDGLCADDDPCPLDPDNDADGDGLCAEIDPCPTFPNLPGEPCQLIFEDGFETGDTSQWSLFVP